MLAMMEQRPVVLIGGGGHALVVGEAIGDGAEIVGFFDDNPEAVFRARFGVERLGALSAIPDDMEAWYILALGNLSVRRRLLVDRLAGARTFGITHRTAFVSGSASVGRGVYVGPNAVVHSFATVADHAIINSGAIVEHDCVIGENSHVAPGAVLGGNVTVGADTLVGLGARVIPGVKVGAGCVVGAGAVVIRDVGDGERVVGVPARARG
ncbi:UDP-N-acetylbacillosamine N-acetyltransferase [Phycisphaerales bacterium]|nr:UDP-N-acetylbacillosamine N-acetyltransferase [Phycisphaerales bacterium]